MFAFARHAPLIQYPLKAIIEMNTAPPASIPRMDGIDRMKPIATTGPLMRKIFFFTSTHVGKRYK
jgi:hypothetical protein